jgi:hypothetical protein
MGFYADTLTALRSAITTRLAGGDVESYTIGDTDIKLCSLETLFKLETQFAKRAADETLQAAGGSRLHFANMRPGG